MSQAAACISLTLVSGEHKFLLNPNSKVIPHRQSKHSLQQFPWGKLNPAPTGLTLDTHFLTSHQCSFKLESRWGHNKYLFLFLFLNAIHMCSSSFSVSFLPDGTTVLHF